MSREEELAALRAEVEDARRQLLEALEAPPIPHIPVRIPADFAAQVLRADSLLQPGHPLYGFPCPACMMPLGSDGAPVALVAVGIPPERRRDHGYVAGGAVAVHAACAGVSAQV